MDDFARPAHELVIPVIGGEQRPIPNSSEPGAGYGLTLDGRGKLPRGVREIKTGLAAARPDASAWVDAFYYATDTSVFSYSNGSAWAAIGDDPGYAAYVPQLTGSAVNPTLGAGFVAVGRFLQVGKLVHCYGRINLGGAGFAAGTGNYQISLPVTASVPIANALIGTAKLLDASAGAFAFPWCQFTGVNAVLFIMAYPAAWPAGAASVVQAATPWAWGQTDDIFWNITYEAA